MGTQLVFSVEPVPPDLDPSSPSPTVPNVTAGYPGPVTDRRIAAIG